MKNTVIFDLDGLLIDSEIISFRLYEELTGKYGRSMTLEEYATDYSGKTSLANMKLLLERYQLPITLEEGMTFVDEREKEYLKDGVALKPGARELLAYLKENHYKILLQHRAPKTAQREFCSRMGFVATLIIWCMV